MLTYSYPYQHPAVEDNNKMNDSIYRRIEQSPRFRELVAKRERFAWILSAIMLGIYVGFILLLSLIHI